MLIFSERLTLFSRVFKIDFRLKLIEGLRNFFLECQKGLFLKKIFGILVGMATESFLSLHRELLYKSVQDFLDIKYVIAQ